MIVLRFELVVGPPEQVVLLPGFGARLARRPSRATLSRPPAGHRRVLGSPPASRTSGGKTWASRYKSASAFASRSTPSCALPELLPDDDRGEAEQHGVDHADDRVDEPATSLWRARTSGPTARRTSSAPPTASAGNTTNEEKDPEPRLDARHGDSSWAGLQRIGAPMRSRGVWQNPAR